MTSTRLRSHLCSRLGAFVVYWLLLSSATAWTAPPDPRQDSESPPKFVPQKTQPDLPEEGVDDGEPGWETGDDGVGWEQDPETSPTPTTGSVNTVVSDHQPLAFTVSGEADLKWVWQPADIRSREAVQPDPGADNFLSGKWTFGFDLVFNEKVRSYFELENRRRKDGESVDFLDDDQNVHLEQAWIEIPRFLDYGVRVRFGLQDLRFSLRDGRDDVAFLLDLTESESAFVGGVTSGDPVFRDALRPGGVRLTLPFGNLETDLFAVVAKEGGSAKDDEVVSGIHTGFRFQDFLTLKALAVVFAGSGTDNVVWTGGGGLAVTGLWKKRLEVYTEAYVQGGTLEGDVDVSSTAGRIGLQLDFNTWGKPWIGGSFWWVQGDKDPTDSNWDGFLSYENVDDFIILEDDDYGLDIDSNYQALKFEAGIRGNVYGKIPDHLTLRMRGGLFRLDEKGSAGTASGALGTELDLTADWRYTESLTLEAGIGVLLDEGMFDDTFALGTIGMKIRF